MKVEAVYTAEMLVPTYQSAGLYKPEDQYEYGRCSCACLLLFLPLYIHIIWIFKYRGADKSLARPDWKKQLKGRYISSDAEVIAAAETWLDGQPSELFLSGLQKLEFGRCSMFPSWSG